DSGLRPSRGAALVSWGASSLGACGRTDDSADRVGTPSVTGSPFVYRDLRHLLGGCASGWSEWASRLARALPPPLPCDRRPSGHLPPRRDSPVFFQDSM